MKICGRCGVEYKCCKTGLIVHDENFHPDSRHQADMYFCPICYSTLINRNDNEYFGEAVIPHVIITNDKEEPLLWDETFVNKMHDDYSLDILNSININSLLQDVEAFRTSNITISSSPEDLIGQIAYADDIISAFLEYTKMVAIYQKGIENGKS